MEWLVVVFYVLGLCFGVYLGKALCYDEYKVKVMVCRNHIQELLDALEVRLQDDDFASDRERAMALGKNEAYYELLDFVDKELIV